MAEGERMGTVTPLDSLFTYEEAQKAAGQVVRDIADREKELNLLRDFIADNSALIRHVQKLPDELSHDIMVPFGGAAFFPGRLVHTNEFMVLLGEGYYAERSAKQTVEILQRRGKSLEAHHDSLKRIIKDLDAKAKYFESTAVEVAEGLVEIREPYVEEIQIKEPEKGLSSRNSMSPLKAHNSVARDEIGDTKIMARLYKLEKEGEEAVSDLDHDKGDETTTSDVEVDEDEDDDDDEDEDGEEEDEDGEEEEDDGDEYGEEEEDDEDENVNGNAESVSENTDKVSCSKVPISPGGSSGSFIKPNNPQLPLETKVYPQKSPSNIQGYPERIPTQTSTKVSTESKAFTGTVVEHDHGLMSTIPPNSSTFVQPSRPVSRFKMMQKGNR